MVTITGSSVLHHDMNIIDWIESYKAKVKQPVNVYLNGKCLVFAKAVKEAIDDTLNEEDYFDNDMSNLYKK